MKRRTRPLALISLTNTSTSSCGRPGAGGAAGGGGCSGPKAQGWLTCGRRAPPAVRSNCRYGATARTWTVSWPSPSTSAALTLLARLLTILGGTFLLWSRSLTCQSGRRQAAGGSGRRRAGRWRGGPPTYTCCGCCRLAPLQNRHTLMVVSMAAGGLQAQRRQHDASEAAFLPVRSWAHFVRCRGHPCSGTARQPPGHAPRRGALGANRGPSDTAH